MGDQKATLDAAIEAFKRYKSGKAIPVKKKRKREETPSGETVTAADAR